MISIAFFCVAGFLTVARGFDCSVHQSLEQQLYLSTAPPLRRLSEKKSFEVVEFGTSRDLGGGTEYPKDSMTTTITATEEEASRTSTPFAGLFSSIASSLTLTLFTEFGDRTFFIAALLALRFPKLLVLGATCAALVIQTVFSTALGQVLHSLPAKAATNPFFALPLDDYAAAILLFVFGCIHLRAAYYDDDDITGGMTPAPTDPKPEIAAADGETTTPYVAWMDDPKGDTRLKQEDDEEDTQSGGDPLSETFSRGGSTAGPSSSPRCSLVQSYTTERRPTNPAGTDAFLLDPRDIVVVSPTAPRRRLSTSNKNQERLEAEMAIETMEQQAHVMSPGAVFSHTFWIIFVAELGDKSMFSTVALATAQNPYGVFIGSSIAHCLVTLVAVAAGGLLEGYISERIANGIGAVLFLTFAALTMLEGLARQGIQMWWFIGEKASALFLAYFVASGRDLASTTGGSAMQQALKAVLSS